MKKFLLIIAIVLIVLALSGCTTLNILKPGATGKPTAGPATSSPQAIAGTSFAGMWDTDWGNMTISVSGNQATGTYDFQGGQIIGTVNGKVMTGTWSEDPTHTPPDDAGALRFTMSDDGTTFTGEWWYGNDMSGNPDGDWVGTRVK